MDGGGKKEGKEKCEKEGRCNALMLCVEFRREGKKIAKMKEGGRKGGRREGERRKKATE